MQRQRTGSFRVWSAGWAVLAWFCISRAMSHAAEMAPLATDTTATLLPVAFPAADDDWLERTWLLGDAGGLRSGLGAQGIAVNLSATQFYQGVASGGADRTFDHSGRVDLLAAVDGEKAGLWRGLFINLHGESRYGDSVNLASGALMPPNTGALFPAPNGGETALTGVKITQALSEQFVTFAGKINTLDELKQPYAGGRGVDAFMNLSLALPVAAARTIPYSTLGGGFAVLHDMQPVITGMILDTNNTPTTSGFEQFFDNGVTLLGRVDVPVTLFDRPGHQGFWGTYSTGKYNDLDPTAYFDPNLGPFILAGQETGSWGLFYSADQALFVDPRNPQRSWGLFTNLGLADDGPSPIRFSGNVGLGGSSPLVSRPRDTFGIGYAYTGFSEPVHQLAPVLIPIRDEHVVELFYNVAITPWFRLTPDLQVIVPARERTLPPGAQDIGTSLLFALRAKIDF